MNFVDKVVIVTGASSGIGAAISERFLTHGAKVATVQRSPDMANDNTEHSYHIQADLSDPVQCEQAITQAIERFGKLDVLINNAGVMSQSSIETMSLTDWQKTIGVNLTAPFLLIKHALAFLKQTQGSIINIGSIEGLAANPNHAAYCASKAGLHGLTRAVAVDHGADDIRCNTVSPGWIDTPLNIDFINSMQDPDKFKHDIAKIHPLKRTGTTQEVANLVCWLASEEASFITGQLFTIDGGRTAQLSLPH